MHTERTQEVSRDSEAMWLLAARSEDEPVWYAQISITKYMSTNASHHHMAEPDSCVTSNDRLRGTETSTYIRSITWSRSHAMLNLDAGIVPSSFPIFRTDQ